MTEQKQDYSAVSADPELLVSQIQTLGPVAALAQGYSEEQVRSGLLGAALARINSVHASFMRKLTGNATKEERDTWKPKEEAARAYLAGSARPCQISMIEEEASGGAEAPTALAARIIGKAEAFEELIGKAGKIRKKARSSVRQAVAPEVPLEQVAVSLAQVYAQLDVDILAGIEAWQSRPSGSTS
jgi:hypothetical protein